MAWPSSTARLSCERPPRPPPYPPRRLGAALNPLLSYRKEVCEADTVMCPLCDRRCKVWQLSDTCTYAKVRARAPQSGPVGLVLTPACLAPQVSLLFDNNGTVLFAMVMAVWGEFHVTSVFKIITPSPETLIFLFMLKKPFIRLRLVLCKRLVDVYITHTLPRKYNIPTFSSQSFPAIWLRGSSVRSCAIFKTLKLSRMSEAAAGVCSG